MIELAPHNKQGLSITGPAMIASGCCGYGDAYQHLIDLTAFGAIVTNPITLRPQRGTAQPRLVETKAGFILDTGRQNPGVRKVIQQYSKRWAGMKAPIIAHLPADEPDNLRRTARALAGTEAIAAIELGIPHVATPRDIQHWVEAIQADCMLPVLVKLPLKIASEMAEAAAKVPADALVIGSPPLGMSLSSEGRFVSGNLYGPAWHSLTLHTVQIIRDLVELPIVAVGGIHSLADIEALSTAGAAAVQIDSLLFIKPKEAERIARDLVIRAT